MIPNLSEFLTNTPTPALVTLTALAVWTLPKLVRKQPKPLPPGPRGWPIVGNLLEMPKEYSWHKFQDWLRQYGDICYINLAGQNVVLLGSNQVAFDLLDKRSGIYSDRPRFHVASDLLSGGLGIATNPPGEYWKKARRVAHEALKLQSAPQFQPLQLISARRLVERILQSPDDVENHISLSALSFSVQSTFGIQNPDANDIRRIAGITTRIGNACVPGAFLVESFPWMKYLPDILAPWRVWANECFKKDSELLERLYRDGEAEMKNGHNLPSVAAVLTEDGPERFTPREKAWALVSLITAADTVPATLYWFVWAMVKFPQVQKQAQLELDKVVGRERVPNFNDFERLPFIRAIVMELLRWMPVAPIGLPHVTTQDDIYGEYFIPEGTLCVTLLPMMNRDQSIYGPDAESFNPSRFIDSSNGNLKPPLPLTHEESHASYGFGRRICVGRAVANQSLFIDAAMLLWSFNFENLDQSKTWSTLSREDYVDHFILTPKPFAHKIVPRFPEVKEILQQLRESDD
ncbi:cytochrome P450 [Flagelloscypha sp. PMI_526]|nr:cytochrome P450 [Flagelloscypha sp. PMI_526]